MTKPNMHPAGYCNAGVVGGGVPGQEAGHGKSSKDEGGNRVTRSLTKMLTCEQGLL